VNIAKLIPITGHDAPQEEAMLSRIDKMGKQVHSQISQAKKAFAARDVGLARDLVRQDDLVDDLNKECFQIAVEVGDDHDTREWAMTMMLVARALERTGDNAVDIGEQVAFVVTGLFREFEDASHPEPAPPPAS
jgi:phosphate transport system protein